MGEERGERATGAVSLAATDEPAVNAAQAGDNNLQIHDGGEGNLSRNPLRFIPSAALIAAAVALVSGCVSNPGDTQNLKQRGSMNRVVVKSKEESQANRLNGQIPIRTIHNTGYVALSDVAAAGGYRGGWLNDGRTFGMGETDVVWSFRTGDSGVSKAGKSFRMPGPAVKQAGRLFVPADALPELFGSEALLTKHGNHVAFVQPHAVMKEGGADGSVLPFSDGRKADRIGVLSISKGDDAVAYARTFMGTKYAFGADPQSTNEFDCSSFTGHVMAKFGVQLPRTAREQAQVGVAVSRDSLMPGDLLFFYVPGRFKSDSVVGHVGIYAGGGQMVNANSAPLNGVQMTDINKPYWTRTYMFAKRVLS